MMLIRVLQISGFAAALVLLFLPDVPHFAFVMAFGVHVVGDILFLRKVGL